MTYTVIKSAGRSWPISGFGTGASTDAKGWRRLYRGHRLIALVGVLGLVGAACGDDDTGAAAPSTTAAAASSPVATSAVSATSAVPIAPGPTGGSECTEDRAGGELRFGIRNMALGF